MGSAEKLVGSERTKQLFDSVSMKDSYGLLLGQLTHMEDDVLRRLRTCSPSELLEVQAEAKVLHTLKERIASLKRKDEKHTPQVMPAGT